jgi:S-adenosylmethionine:diacylglycerol 3-amino-3-carboxypropyl transferase
MATTILAYDGYKCVTVSPQQSGIPTYSEVRDTTSRVHQTYLWNCVSRVPVLAGRSLLVLDNAAAMPSVACRLWWDSLSRTAEDTALWTLSAAVPGVDVAGLCRGAR